ncbi:MAG: sensor domain-containing diguanylate cyclase [Acidobacteria bacterium]|nr:sensor domain-containing diguanylate cyclase [Acidobacteriota bacterium]
MSRTTVFRATQWVVVLMTAALVVWAAVAHDPRFFGYSLFFSGLVLVASFLRIEAGEASVTFEAAVVFGAIILFHDPDVALVAVFVGCGLHAFYERRKLVALLEPAQLALSYFLVASLYTSAVARDARPMAKVSGYVLLLVGCVVTQLAFASLRRWFDSDVSPVDFRPTLAAQGKTLLLLSPVVGIEVLLFANYGIGGFAIAFLPVLLVAYAMRNESDAERQNAELVRRNRELSILTESSTQILSAEGDAETLKRLMALLSKLAHLKACAVVTWSANPDLPGTVYRFGECLPSDQEILRWVDHAGFAESAPSRAFVFRDEQRRFPLSGGGAIQVLIGIQTPEVIYGILIFETDDSSILKTGSLNLLTLLVNQTALSLQDQLLQSEMRNKTRELEERASTMSTILEVSNSLIGSFDLDGALTRIAQAIRTSLGFEQVVIALLDQKRNELTRRAHAGLDAVWDEAKRKHIPLDEITPMFDADFRVSSSFFVSHKALRQSDHDFFVHHQDSGLMAEEWHENDLLIVPLVSADQLIGYVSVREPHDRRVPTLEKVQTLEVFAVQAVTALQSARQYDEIRRLTYIDSLTPAYNHRFFQEQLGKEIHRHARNGREFALAMLDIDNFKRINDTFGHPVGDEILKALVDELITNARDSDIVSRYGGEEFAIIFPDTPAHSARDAANRLREIIERCEFRISQLHRNLPITISIGVACYPRDGVTNADLIARADSALYWVKKHGKNQVAVAAEIPTVVQLMSS